ncbi:ribonuclease-3 [Nitrosomonas sp. Nm51]|uniref:ribonuclease III n=1 Tax=Nitrosomonas sp. Nm51 TaxID=133720 RepID=UPI0008BA402F|nr:ribonuclease III [Nitrosomonas sp. Nm51]SER08685.1 ribonuclease-3 [Nitrosomonas sp. Nm51]
MRSNWEIKVDLFCNRLGYQFAKSALLHEALTHRSHNAIHNERLEFLGDSVLNCAVAALIFKRFRDIPEGQLSLLRASMVNQKALFEMAMSLEMDQLIQLGEGELKSGGRRRPSILADALEAVFGAIYLDNGFAQAEAVIDRLYTPALETIDRSTHGKDPKTLLQELLQSRKLDLPAYTVITTTGKAHQQKFRVECAVPEFNILTQGEGSSRRSAEQAAAKKAYDLALTVDTLS